jgi:hypothetical protein
MKLIILLLLASCASGPTLDELYLQRAQCLQKSSDCKVYDDAINKKEDAIARREAKKGPVCPRGLVAFCKNGHCTCKHMDDIRWMLGW